MNLCPNCFCEPSQQHPLFGVMIGVNCQKKQQTQSSPGEGIEFTSEEIKSQRVQFAKDTIKPFRSGEVSRQYIEEYGTKSIEVTEKEVKEAMKKPDVWSGDLGHNYYRE